MTISTSTNKFRYEGNGVTDTFAFNARIFATSDIVVEIITRSTDSLVETLSETTDYTVTINSPESASVQVTNASKVPSLTQDIQIRRNLPDTQSLNLPTGTVFPAVSVENSLDKSVALIQDLSEEVGRAIKLPSTSSLTNIVLPDAVASEVLGWNSAGDNLTTYAFGDISTSIDTVFSGLASGDYLKYNGSEWNNINSDQLKTDLSISKNNTAPSNPTVNDDDTEGYTLFSEWINTSTTEKWVCLDNTTGAAVWEQGTLDSSDLGSASIADLLDEDDMSSNSATDVPSQQSVKAYVDNNQKGIELQAAVATTSGTAIDFTGVPSGVNRVTLHLKGVSLSGADDAIVQLGDSGGIETSGYQGGYYQFAGSYVSSTNGFILRLGNAGRDLNGFITLNRVSGNDWAVNGMLDLGPVGASGVISVGTKSLSGEITQIRLTRTGTNTFDAGEASISWEF